MRIAANLLILASLSASVPAFAVQSGYEAAQNPDVIIASWCGRQVKKQWIRERAGWANVSAVRDNHLYEVKSTYILQPGPAALTEGARQIHNILACVMGVPVSESLQPREKVDATLKNCLNAT